MNLDNLRDTIQNISLYDVKAAVRKAQNVVMNYTEMEAKVREATNNEPWGASSTLMQEIASGTYNYQLLNEIMPMIYKRFTEKTAEEWRQIYKALQLLEFLVKHGSEQVIDDGRSHLSTIKMLRQFHYIDMNGKDQGINVRNRAKELAELLSDVDRIRTERKKARASKNKYGGVEGGAGAYGGMSGGMSGDNGFGRRYGGFGSESLEFGGYSGGVYGDGGGFSGSGSGGGRSGGFHDEGISRPGSRTTQKFEEYDEYDDGANISSRRAAGSGASSSTRRKEAPAVKPPPKKKEPEADLFSFGDEPISSSKQKQPSNALDDEFGTLQSGGADDDDFDDFQSASGPAPVASTAFPAPTAAKTPLFNAIPPLTASASSTNLMQPKPMSAGQAAGLSDLVGIASISPAPSMNSRGIASPPSITPATTGGGFAGLGGMGGMGGMAAMKPSNATSAGYQPAQPNYFTSVSTIPGNTSTPLSPVSTGTSTSAQQKKPAGDAFGNIWNSAAKDFKKPSTPTNTNSPSLQAMAKEKASAGIWGAPASGGSSAYGGSTAGKIGGGLDDLLG